MGVSIELFVDSATQQALSKFPQIQTEDYDLVTREGRPSDDHLLISTDQYSPGFEGTDTVWLTVVATLGALGYKFLENMASTLGKELGERIATAIKEWRKPGGKPTERQLIQFRFDDAIYTIQLDKSAQTEIVSHPEEFVQTTFEFALREKIQRNRVLYFDSKARQWKI